MPKKLINIIILFIIVGAIYWFRGLITEIKNRIIPNGLNYCLTDNDCVPVEEKGNRNCYNKKYLPAEIDNIDFNPAIFYCSCVQGYCENNSKNVVK